MTIEQFHQIRERRIAELSAIHSQTKHKKMQVVKRSQIGRPPRPVRCVETGIVYRTIREAANAIGVVHSAVHKAAVRGWKCHGFTWRFV